MSTQPSEVYTPDLPQYARLHLARFMAGLEMQELADRMDVSRGTVSHYEDADYSRQRQRSTIRLWALATGYPFEWLADGVTYQSAPVSTRPDREGAGSGKRMGYFTEGHSAEIVQLDHARFRLRPTGT